MAKQKITVEVAIHSFAHGKEGLQDRQDYLQALRSELESAADYAEDYEIDTIAITGDHPLQYPAHALADILRKLRNSIPLGKEPEITLYARPGSVTYADMFTLRDQGLNRVSFDMQSFVPQELDALGRTYSPRAMEVFMRMVQLKLVFFNYDITLGYGLPGQTLESLAYSVEQAIHFQAMHLTLQPYPGADPQLLEQYYQHAAGIIGLTSFQQYTPYHFARPGYFCRWLQAAYSNQPRLGFGAGAQSRIEGVASVNTSNVRTYIIANGDPQKLIESIQPVTEIYVQANDLLDSLYNQHVCSLEGFNPDLCLRIQTLCDQKLLIADEKVVLLTQFGKMKWPLVAANLHP